MEKVELKSCPFCGPGELQTFHLGSLYFVQCVKCDTEQTGRTEADAAKAWNTRANDEEIARYRAALEIALPVLKAIAPEGMACFKVKVALAEKPNG